MNYDADDSADEIWCWWNEVHAVDSIKGQRKRRRARKWGTSHLSAADIGSREHGVEKKVKVNMKWKRKWKWTWSEKEIGFFFVDILYSQLVKWPNYQMTVLWELAWLNIRKLIRADQKIAQKRFLRNIKSNIYLDSCAAFDISFVILTSNIFWLQYNFFVILIEMRSLLCNCRKYKVNLIRHRTMVF